MHLNIMKIRIYTKKCFISDACTDSGVKKSEICFWVIIWLIFTMCRIECMSVDTIYTHLQVKSICTDPDLLLYIVPSDMGAAVC